MPLYNNAMVSQEQIDAAIAPYMLGDNRTLFRLIGANLNSTGDQLFVPAFTFTNFIVLSIIATNASGVISLATGGIYTATSKGGTAIVSAAQSWAGLTSTTKTIFLALGAAASDLRTGNLYLSLTTPMGSAGTCDIYVMGVAG